MSENRTIENDRIRLTATPKAGEMLSLFDKTKNREILYQADEGWSGRNPSLFPMVGSTWKEGRIEIDGQTYQMKNHGLIRYAQLKEETEKEKPDEIIYSFDSSEETRKQYPFDFHYEMKYSLDGDTVKVSYRITNPSDRDLPFSFGLHPAFKTAQSEDETFEDFSIRFENGIHGRQLVFTPDLQPVQRVEADLDEWKLSRNDLKKYATIVYEGAEPGSATLYYRDEPRMKMSFHDYPYLALWSHPAESEFVCIEPWYGHADFEKTEAPFEKREGTVILPPHQTFEAEYEITVL